MTTVFPLVYHLHDGTQVKVYKNDDNCYEFYLARLNSEKHNFQLINGKIEESYETRFDELQHEAVKIFEEQFRKQEGA